MHMYFEKVNIVFLYMMLHLDTSGTYKHSELAHAYTVSSCVHKGCTCPVAQAVECPLRET